MRIEHLREFIVLGQTLNYTKAADELCITQPVLSRHIDALETELGVRLLYRDTHSVALTREGEYALRRIKHLVSSYDDMLHNLARLSGRTTGHLVAGVPYYGIQDYVRRFFSAFKSHHPEIEFTLQSAQPAHLVDALISRELDVICDFAPVLAGIRQVITHRVGTEPLVAMMRNDHPLAMQTAVRVSDLAYERIIFARNVQWKESLLRVKLAEHGVYDFECLYDESVDAVALTVAETNGVSLVARGLTTVNWQGVTCLPIVDDGFEVEILLAYRDDNDNPAIPQLLKSLDL